MTFHEMFSIIQLLAICRPSGYCGVWRCRRRP